MSGELHGPVLMIYMKTNINVGRNVEGPIMFRIKILLKDSENY